MAKIRPCFFSVGQRSGSVCSIERSPICAGGGKLVETDLVLGQVGPVAHKAGRLLDAALSPGGRGEIAQRPHGGQRRRAGHAAQQGPA